MFFRGLKMNLYFFLTCPTVAQTLGLLEKVEHWGNVGDDSTQNKN